MKYEKEELLEVIRKLAGDKSDSDEMLEVYDNIDDTYAEVFNNDTAAEVERLNTELSENDKKWRQRYRDRFFGKIDDEKPGDDTPDPRDIRFEDLFREEKN